MSFTFEEIDINIGQFVEDKIRSLIPSTEIITLESPAGNFLVHGESYPIKVTVKNGYGSPISNKQLVITDSWNFTYNVTTNNNGEATFNYNPFRAGVNVLKCENTELTLRVGGFRQIMDGSPHVQVRTNGSTVWVIFSVWTNSRGYYEYDLGRIPTDYTPGKNLYPVMCPEYNTQLTNAGHVIMNATVTQDGKILANKSVDTSQSGGVIAYGVIEYSLSRGSE